jgi:hypothetical protein
LDTSLSKELSSLAGILPTTYIWLSPEAIILFKPVGDEVVLKTALPEFKSLIFDTQNCLNLISLIFDTQNLLDNVKELQYEKFEHLPDMETWSEENLPFPCIGLSQRAHKQMDLEKML